MTLNVWIKEKDVSYVACNRNKLWHMDDYIKDLYLYVLISEQFNSSSDIIYDRCTSKFNSLENLKGGIDKQMEWDIFKITSYRIEYDPLFLDTAAEMAYSKLLNELSSSLGKKVISIYTSYEFGKHISFGYETTKKRKAKFYIIFAGDIEYIPSEKYEEPILKSAYKVSFFKEFICPNLEAQLNAIGIKYDGEDSVTDRYLSDTLRLKDTNTIQFDIGNNEAFKKELDRAINKHFDAILNDMYDGKFKDVIKACRIKKDSIRKLITTHNCSNDMEVDIAEL